MSWRVTFKHILDINNELIEEYEDVDTFEEAIEYARNVEKHLDVKEISFGKVDEDEFTWNL